VVTQLRRSPDFSEAGWAAWQKLALGAAATICLCACTAPWKISVHNQTGRDIRLSIVADDPRPWHSTIELAPSGSILMPFELSEIEQVRYEYDGTVCVLTPSDIVSSAYPVRPGSKQTRLDLTPCSPDSGPA
jgi:hypothetical protein